MKFIGHETNLKGVTLEAHFYSAKAEEVLKANKNTVNRIVLKG